MLKKKAMIKTAGFSLPENNALWNSEILKYLFKTNDWLDVDHYFLRWGSSFDGDKGVGTGAIILSKGEKSFSIPVIIKDFKLQPMDVFFFDGEFRPLTQRTVDEALKNISIADKLTTRKGDAESMFKNIFPPAHNKIACMLTASKEELKALTTDPDTAELFARLLTKEAGPDVTTVVLEEDSGVGYSIQYMDGGKYFEKKAGFKTASDFLKDKVGYNSNQASLLLKEASERVVTVETTEKRASVSRTEPTIVTGSANILAKTKAGADVAGQLIPWTINLDRGAQERVQLLVGENRQILGISTEKVIGQHLPGQKINMIFSPQVYMMPRPGMVVSFAWKGGSGGFITATRMVKIVSMEDIAGEGLLFKVLSEMGGQHNVMLVTGLRKAVLNKDNKNKAFYLPSTAVILYAKGEVPELISSMDDYKSVKLAGVDVLSLYFSKGPGEISVNSDLMKKTASPREVRLSLVDLGVPFDEADRAVNDAKTWGSSEIHLEKQAKSPEVPDWLVEDIKAIGRSVDLVKLANTLGDVDTIDKILSLNLVNKKNIVVFFKMLPSFKETVRSLAKLLVTSRLGNVGVNTDTVQEAMQALQALVEKMEGFKLEQ